MNAVLQTNPGRPVDIGALPADALLTRRQIEQITGFRVQTLKNWAAVGRGPKITTVEKRPRYRAADVREWLTGRGAR
jgi:hypothetical protein